MALADGPRFKLRLKENDRGHYVLILIVHQKKERLDMKCEICGRETNSEFCELHKKAYENLIEKYELWKRASNITWTEYLKKILTNPNAGLWVKEVAQQLLRDGSSKISRPP